MTRALAAAATLAAAAALAACGRDDPLSDEDELAVIRAVSDLSYYCPHSDAPQRPAPPHIVRGMDRLIEIHKKDPDAIHLDSHGEERSPMST